MQVTQVTITTTTNFNGGKARPTLRVEVVLPSQSVCERWGAGSATAGKANSDLNCKSARRYGLERVFLQRENGDISQLIYLTEILGLTSKAA